MLEKKMTPDPIIIETHRPHCVVDSTRPVILWLFPNFCAQKLTGFTQTPISHNKLPTFFFRMLRWLGRKENHSKKTRNYHFTKSFISVALLTSLGNYSHSTLFLPKKQTSRAALLWSGWSPRWLNMLSVGHTDSICLPLRCWWTIRPSCVQALK